MIKLINRSGGETWVADDRVEEYLAAGHKLAAEEEPAEKPKRKPAAKKK